MNTRNSKLMVWLAMLAVVMACVPSLATPFPTTDPNQINQIIAQTANAAATRTAAALPSATPTVLTPTPQNTFTPSPTFTSTVIFVLATPTGSATPTVVFLLGGGGTSADDFACQIMSVNPANGTSFDSRRDFDVTWKVKNIGQKNWSTNNIDFVFDSGTNMSETAGYDLPTNVGRDRTVDLVAELEAPRRAGNYTTTWALQRGTNAFCKMSLTINVR